MIADAATEQPVELFHRVSSALKTSPHLPQRRKIVVETESGNVRLSGNVPTFFEKQMAQEVIRRVDGVEGIENLIEVNWG